MLSRVRRVVAELGVVSRELEPALLEGGDAATLVELAARGERLCAAIKARAACRVDETKAWRNHGHRSPAHWLAEKSGETVGAATRVLGTARALDGLPETEAAFRDGDLSGTQACEIVSAASSDPSAERALLDAARHTSVKGLRDRCRQTSASAEADDQAWARRLHQSRRLHRWTDRDGAYRADVRLAPDAGARFDAALEAHLDRVFAEARRSGRRELRAAYAADALVALAAEGPCKPVEVRVNVDSAVLARGHIEPDERCEITGIGPIPATTARKLVEDSRISLVVHDGDDVIASSRASRTIPARLRRRVEARYPTCGVKSCANDQFLQIDHVRDLAGGGPTSDDNLWRLCLHHHALKTRCGWKVVGTTHGWDLVPPGHPDANGNGAGRDPP